MAWNDWLTKIVKDLLAVFLDPGERIYWGSLLGAIAIIFLLSGRQWRRHFRTLCSRELWMHPSSRADFKLIAANILFRSLLLPSTVGFGIGLASLISVLLTRLLGERPDWNWPSQLVLGLFTLSLFLADDFARFYAHYLQHRWRWLWCFHQVHHSAVVLTPVTLYRTHPGDIILARVRDAVSYGSVTGLFYYAFGTSLSTWDILGVNVFSFLFNIAGANLRHSQVQLHFGFLEPWILSPAAHQIHHSRDPVHYDKNFGVCLTIWDRLWGTHFDARKLNGPLCYGLDHSPLSSLEQSLKTLYWEPLRQAFRKREANSGASLRSSHSAR